MFVTNAQTYQERLNGIVFGFSKSGCYFTACVVGVLRLKISCDGDGTVGQVRLVEVAVCIINIGDGRVDGVEVVIEASGGEVAVFVFIGSAHLDFVAFAKLVVQAKIAYYFFFVQLTIVSHGFLLVEFEEAQCTGIVFAEHHLTAVGFVTSGFAV
ncbi:hypothetical protein SDC9_149888 [bioreactor metagenome]|uniref:Uncharacterized protein n=1 Tax=bioreactor metagenome TaxID=1076179 RepID=A0A645EN32_9ZZZZ